LRAACQLLSSITADSHEAGSAAKAPSWHTHSAPKLTHQRAHVLRLLPHPMLNCSRQSSPSVPNQADLTSLHPPPVQVLDSHTFRVNLDQAYYPALQELTLIRPARFISTRDLPKLASEKSCPSNAPLFWPTNVTLYRSVGTAPNASDLGAGLPLMCRHRLEAAVPTTGLAAIACGSSRSS
jgi:hypothetical protein